MTNPDPTYLKSDQYKDASRLAARARLHAQYSRNPYGWFNWLFEQYKQTPPNARVLELGAGAGWLWAKNLARIPAGWDITLSDFASGMLAEARKTLAQTAHDFRYEEIDAQHIPYPDATFDAVIANHMLYHVPDRAKAIAEMRRVLKPDGRLYTATNGENHMREIHALMARLGFRPEEWLDGFVMVRGYTLENAPGQLRVQFPNVEVRRYEDEIVVGAAQPVLDYILSFPVQPDDQRIAELRAFVEAEIARIGSFTITKDSGIVVASA